MMNVYDTANRLASEIKDSQEYLNYKKIKEEINNTPELKKKIEDFSKLRYDIQVSQFQDKGEDKTKLEQFQKMYMEMIQNDKIKTYFDAELKFNVLLTDVNKIIGEAVQDVIK